ncbi:hypothetical protein D8M33_09245 [Micrococcus sp. HSID17245]|nr:hypothetical protein D8M33_09245 [Micrococcus sp. HSID17245]
MVAEADRVAEGAADVTVTEDAAAVDAFAVEETLPGEAEHPEMAVPRRTAATTAADNAARFFSMSIRMIRSLSENRLRGRGLRSRAPPPLEWLDPGRRCAVCQASHRAARMTPRDRRALTTPRTPP